MDRHSDRHIPENIVAAFPGMHVSPAKHSSEKCDRQETAKDGVAGLQSGNKI